MLSPLEIIHLTKNYGSVEAVKDVSFQLKQGEVFGLLGPNGAGKTSIISTIVTLEEPTSGQVLVFGNDVTKKPREAKRLTGFVPQEIINHGFFNVEEILNFHSGYFGLNHNQNKIDELLKRLMLWDHRKKRVKQLSGGMKRRLLIAKALLHSPQLLLLDEPTAGVDIELREQLWDFVRELKESGTTVLLTTHYLEEAEQLCDRVGILQEGELKKVGQTKDLIQELTNREVHLYIKEEMPQIKHPLLMSQTKGRVSFSVPSTRLLGEFLFDLQIDLKSITDIRIEEGSLEKAFRHVLGVNGES